jgi:hypothetical protein
MGGAVISHYSSIASNQIYEYEFFAFQVIDYNWKNGTIAEDMNPTPVEGAIPEKISDLELQRRVEDILIQSYKEKDLPINECRCPAVVLFKYFKLSDQEKDEYQTTLLDAAIAKDKANYQSKMKASAIEDYSKSFGGTANDTKNEKDAAEILRGGEGGSAGGNTGVNEDSNTALLQPPNILHMSEHFVLRKAGKWCK